MLLSTGERISCALCAMAIHDMGHERDLAHRLAGRDRHRLLAHEGADHRRPRRPHPRGAGEDRIVLVAGFQGVSGDSKDVTTLGRGGSDTTAVAIAAALGADVCEIYTDVAGVFSADPRLVAGARKLALVSFDEMLEMSSSGAGVLQLRAVEYGAQPRRPHPLPQLVRGRPRYPRARRGRDDGAPDGHSRDARLRGARDPDRAPRRAGRRRPRLRRARRRQRQRRHDHPERAGLRRPEGRPLVHGRQRRPRARPPTCSSRSRSASGSRPTPQVGKVSIVGAGMRSHPGRRREGLPDPRRAARSTSR